ncbi:hypothetical protein BH11PSE9_BH11PSE9_02380 [soil metagenome]
MKIPLIAAAAAALALTAPMSQATVIDSAYKSLGGDAWLVDFTITNDGTPASFFGFSIDMPNATNLVLVASPATWDSVVFQQDPNLPDDAYLDSFVIAPSNALTAGQSIKGFEVSFTYAAGAMPGAMPFVVYDETFAPLFSGTTTVSAVPEPASVMLAALGLAVVGLRTARSAKRNVRSFEEVVA